VVLVYRSETGDETLVEFAIDGRLSPQHGEAFEHAGLKRKLGVGSDGLHSAETIALEVFGPDVVARAKTAEALQLQKVITTAEQQLAVAEQAPDLPPETAAPAARAEIERAERALDDLDVRPIETFEHPTLLTRALTKSTERLVIVSPWIRRHVVNGLFLSQLEDRLERGVKVYIGWGMSEATRVEDADVEPLRALEKLARRYGNLWFVWFGDTHAKILISDQRFAVATSFNWLSFKGDPRRAFREERGILVKDPRVVDAQFDAIIPRFPSPEQPPVS
jgi:phosphatidylserine/phosphatidylglycerophosphate/cardiolipin synthase-like enzyme